MKKIKGPIYLDPVETAVAWRSAGLAFFAAELHNGAKVLVYHVLFDNRYLAAVWQPEAIRTPMKEPIHKSFRGGAWLVSLGRKSVVHEALDVLVHFDIEKLSVDDAPVINEVLKKATKRKKK